MYILLDGVVMFGEELFLSTIYYHNEKYIHHLESEFGRKEIKTGSKNHDEGS